MPAFPPSLIRAVRRWRRPLVRAVLLVLVVLPVSLLAIYRFLPPPVTPLMVIRLIEGYGLTKDWQSLDEISPNLRRAVIASEDAKFCSHSGFDWDAIDNAIDRYGTKRPVVGASTISMQTAKNLLLWPGRTFLRKGLEAYLTLYLEALWPKRRILETYLNIAEFGPGLYGAEAAAQHYFRKSAGTLSKREAALLTAVLPAPLSRNPARPTAGLSRQAQRIDARAGQVRLGDDGACD